MWRPGDRDLGANRRRPGGSRRADDRRRRFGLKRCGARAQSTFATESGWIASPLPAIYSGETMKAYRDWLSADSFEATASLGGSYCSKRIEDYYLTPWDLGYGHFVKFDHDFIGRDALAARANQPHRQKVSLSWDSEDILRVFESMLGEGDRAKYMDMPAAYYTTFAYDAVLKDGRGVGISTYVVYTSNGREWISTAIVDEEVAQPGTEVTVLWGEPDGGAAKSNVETHVQMPIRAIVVPSPVLGSRGRALQSVRVCRRVAPARRQSESAGSPRWPCRLRPIA